MITITHSEISSVTAGRLGNVDASTIAKHVSEYAKTTMELMREKGPNSTKEVTLVETPLVGYEVTYHDSGTRKGPDGSEEKLGPHRRVKTAVPNALLKGINADLIKVVGQVAKAVAEGIKKAA